MKSNRMIETLLFTLVTIRLTFTTSLSFSSPTQPPNEINRHVRPKILEGLRVTTDEEDTSPDVTTSIAELNELGRMAGSVHSDTVKDEIDIDKIISFAELNEVSRMIGGPHFDEQTISLDFGKEKLWSFDVDRAKDDIDEMCMEQLNGIMKQLGEEEFDEYMSPQVARGLFWGLVNSFIKDYNSTDVEKTNAYWKVIESIVDLDDLSCILSGSHADAVKDDGDTPMKGKIDIDEVTSIAELNATLEELRDLVWSLVTSSSEDYNSTIVEQGNNNWDTMTPLVDRNDRKNVTAGSHIDIGQYDNDTPTHEEFDINEITSFAKLNEVSRKVGGPHFDIRISTLESAKNQLWDFEEERAKDDIDEMCMKQLTGIMKQLGRGHFAEGTTLQEARNLVWNLAQNFSEDYSSTHVVRSYRQVTL